jgi:hypothetical protein
MPGGSSWWALLRKNWNGVQSGGSIAGTISRLRDSETTTYQSAGYCRLRGL